MNIKFTMHGHMNIKFTMHGHMNRKFTMHGHMNRKFTMHGHMNIKKLPLLLIPFLLSSPYKHLNQIYYKQSTFLSYSNELILTSCSASS